MPALVRASYVGEQDANITKYNIPRIATYFFLIVLKRKVGVESKGPKKQLSYCIKDM